jgi:hypothetical protein
MSFSLSAAGTKKQTVDSLSKSQVNDSMGERVREFLKDLIEHDTTDGGETHDVRHSVSASGHAGAPGSVSYLTVSHSAALMPKPEPSEPPK